MTNYEIWSKQARWELVPIHMRDGVRRWVESGLMTGSFLTAIMEHKFYEAIVYYADDINRERIVDWAKFLYLSMPINSHGPNCLKTWKGMDNAAN